MKSKPDFDKQLALSLSVKAMNDMLGSERQVPSSFAVGEFQIRHKIAVPTKIPPLEYRSEIPRLVREDIW